MILLNFSHPLSEEQVQQVEEATDRPLEQIVERQVHCDAGQPLAPQVVALADSAGLTAAEWQTAEIMVLPPALNFIAGALLAELHGRMGYFPPLARTRPVAGSMPPRFEIAEIVNLQAIRDDARRRR